MKQDRISIRLTAELRRKLDVAAKRNGRRPSDVVREALERELASVEPAVTAYDLALKCGLIGAVKGASPDLSTNQEHFKGFGRS